VARARSRSARAALAAAGLSAWRGAACRPCRCGGACVANLHGDEIVEPGAPLRRGLYDANVICSKACWQLGAEVSDLHPGVTSGRTSRAARRAAKGHESGAASGRLDRGSRLLQGRDRGAGKLVFWRVNQAGAAVAMACSPGQARDRRGVRRPAAIRSRVRDVRARCGVLLRLAGARRALVALPVVSGFAYRKRKAGANMCACH